MLVASFFIFAIIALALAACDGEATAPSAPGTVMLGRWQYATSATNRDRPSLNAGLQVTLAIDSVDRADFAGMWSGGSRVTWASRPTCSAWSLEG